MLESRYLNAFITLMREKSVGKAADKLNVSQPALSATLRKLRETFDDPLFVRMGRGVVPTDRAYEILKVVKEISGLFEQIDRNAVSFDPMCDPLFLRIQASDYAHTMLLPRIMAALPDTAPGVTIDIRPLAFDRLETSLADGDLDFAILPDFLAPQSLQMRKIFEETFVWISRADHAMAQAEMTVEALATCQHIRVAPVSQRGRKNRVDQAFEEAGLTRDVRLTVPNYVTVPEVVASTDLVAFVPSSLASMLGPRFAVKKSPLTFDSYTMSLIWHPRKQTLSSHKWVRDFLVRMAPR